jgi:hypothetical protein
MKRYLSIDRCPHHGYYAISLDAEHCGTRLTNGKCCGQWTRVKAWEMTPAQLRSIATEMECAAVQMEQEIDSCPPPSV